MLSPIIYPCICYIYLNPILLFTFLYIRMVFSIYLYVFSEMQEMMDWFCKDKSPTIRDLQLSGRKLCISDLLSPCEVMSIPGEAVDADLTVLKRFFSDDAWNKLLMLCKRINFNLTYFLLSNLENRESMRIFRNVDCVLANHKKV